MVMSTKRDATLSICLEMLHNNTHLPEFHSCVSTTEIGFRGIEVSCRATRIATTDRNVNLPNLLYNSYVVDLISVRDLLYRELITAIAESMKEETVKGLFSKNIKLY